MKAILIYIISFLFLLSCTNSHESKTLEVFNNPTESLTKVVYEIKEDDVLKANSQLTIIYSDSIIFKSLQLDSNFTWTKIRNTISKKHELYFKYYNTFYLIPSNSFFSNASHIEPGDILPRYDLRKDSTGIKRILGFDCIKFSYHHAFGDSYKFYCTSKIDMPHGLSMNLFSNLESIPLEIQHNNLNHSAISFEEKYLPNEPITLEYKIADKTIIRNILEEYSNKATSSRNKMWSIYSY